jgi:hypothetical protein
VLARRFHQAASRFALEADDFGALRPAHRSGLSQVNAVPGADQCLGFTPLAGWAKGARRSAGAGP